MRFGTDHEINWSFCAETMVLLCLRADALRCGARSGSRMIVGHEARSSPGPSQFELQRRWKAGSQSSLLSLPARVEIRAYRASALSEPAGAPSMSVSVLISDRNARCLQATLSDSSDGTSRLLGARSY